MTWRRSIAWFAVALLVAACRLAQAPASPQSFFFIQMSDPQFGFIAPNAGFKQETENFSKAIAAANRLRPAFVVVTGDLTHRQGDTAQIAEYRRIVGQLDPSIAVHNVPGNHDLGLPLSSASIAAYRRVFGPDYYEFDSHGMHGIVINSSLFKEPSLAPAEAAAQEAWLRSKLGAARGKYSRVIVFQHHPWFLTSADEPDQYYNLPLARRREFLDLFARSGVTHVFAGHYHRNAFGKDGALEMVTTGPVGKPLGADSSGVRVVVVDRGRVVHFYYALDSIPVTVRVER
jgi:3',5'-cyclic AMP phosphodiesterase CpdA